MDFDYEKLAQETACSVMQQIMDYETNLWHMEFSPAVERILNDWKFGEIDVCRAYPDSHKHFIVSDPQKVIKRLSKYIDKEVDRRFAALLETIKSGKPSP